MLGTILKKIFGSKSRISSDEEYEELIIKIDLLPLNEVKSLVNNWLAELSEEHIRVSKQSGELKTDVTLPNTVKDFYSLYNEFDVVNSDLILCSKNVGVSKLRPEYVRVGLDVGYSEIVVCGSEDMVYLVDGSEADFSSDSEKMKSIWHYLLLNVLTVYPEFREKLKKGEVGI